MQMEADKEPLSYYGVLGVGMNSSAEELRRAYRKLAMQWHPDRWLKTPSLLGQAKRKFQQIQEAYSVLSDQRKRTLYDAGLYDPDDEQDEGFSDFLQEMVSLMKQTRKEGRIVQWLL
ncbi:dnaJ homolog subfamily B member 6-like isoform X2 [Juglans microcarpa x Juglans regia]|uniref:dnaJ homolog subfamily B member 6-like isoform X2 n=1 Tax=Juglans microcarpa x Juglans regia TaxID=2249226 RepID=UPI001B7EE741|nr:dnaJ homolog subfamily B member 6-like isoform X2 [Juglans microcarpa x Juglans regia]